MPDKTTEHLAAQNVTYLPRDVAGHTISADDFIEDDDYTEEVRENDPQMIAFLSRRRKAMPGSKP